MRIVAGTLRGRTVDAPTGLDTRPTTDRVREALFSSLYSLRGGFDGAVVLDAFAGSGALGLEAISRGAESCVFFENNAKAAAQLRRNIESCGLSAPRVLVVQRDVIKQLPKSAGKPFDLVFLDPPYAYDHEQVLGMVSSLRSSASLAGEAIIVYEHALKDANAVAKAAEEAGFTVQASRKYGKTGISILWA